MKGGREHRRHAARVAAVATVVVLASYVLAVIILNLFVVHRLTTNTDARLADRLIDASRRTLSIPTTGSNAISPDRDVDDAPTFLWAVKPSGNVTALTQGAPSLPHRDWGDAPVTLAVGPTRFRFDTLESQGVLLVAGQSVANATGVRSTLLLPEFIFGLILSLLVFAGALIVGLRASAPSELIRRRQAEFTADASHELRTPLSVIEAEVELGLRKTRDPATYEAILHRVAQESLRLRRIVEDLLWLARADNDPAEVQEGHAVDVAEVVAGSVERFKAVASTRDVTIQSQCVGDGPFTVQAASDWIDRLAGVLIDNACKFAGTGGRVEVQIRATANRIELHVDDSGPGIALDQREAVFDRFHRATDTVAGTGLGLAIADTVVRATHGTWSIGTSSMGGARMGVSWRRLAPRRSTPGPSL